MKTDPDNAKAPDNSVKVRRILRLAKLYGSFLRFYPEGSEGFEGDVVNTDGSFVENFHEKLGDDFKGDADTLSRFQKSGIKGVFKSYMDARRKIGMSPEKLVEIPGDNSSDEVRAAFHKAAGKPDTIDGYDEYQMPDELKEKVEMNDERLVKFKQFAFDELNLSHTQLKKALDFYYQDIADITDAFDLNYNETQAQKAQDAEKALKDEWKNDYEDRVLRCNAVLRKYGGADAIEAFSAQNSPLMAKFLDNIASAMSEDKIKGLTGVSTPTLAQIGDRLAEIKAHPAFMDKKNPEHAKIMAEYSRLWDLKKPA